MLGVRLNTVNQTLRGAFRVMKTRIRPGAFAKLPY